MLEVNTPRVSGLGYTLCVSEAGPRLRRLLADAGLSQSDAAKICGYRHQSGIGRLLASKNDYFLPDVVNRLAKLIGKGTPPISEAQIQAFAVPVQLSTGPRGTYPENQVTDSSQRSVPSSSRDASGKGVVDMEASLIHRLIEDVALLKSQVRELKTRVAKREDVGTPTPRPHRARRSG